MLYSSRREWLAAVASAALAAHSSRASGAESTNLSELTLQQASNLIAGKKASPVDLTQACLDRVNTFNPKVNAWITVMREQALEQAKTLESEQAAGKLRSPLHGIPIGLKDTVDTKGIRTTAASALYEFRFPTEDAFVVEKLRSAGAIILGKCNMHEFDAGPTSAVSYWGPVRNPWNLERVSGGPSGGSAAAVATGQCYAAIGTDATGGIRLPAAWCGVVGLTPTYGRVSLRGIVPYSWSLDHCGPLTRNAADAALVLQQIAGYDFKDIDCVDRSVPEYGPALHNAVSNLRIGVAPQFFDHLDPEVRRAIDEALAVLKKITRDSREVSLPSLLRAGVTAEVAAYHEDLHGVNGGNYEPSTVRAFPASAASARAVDYIRGWRELQTIRRSVDQDIFEKQNVDILVAPTTRRGAPTIEEVLAAGSPRSAAPSGSEEAAPGGGNAPAPRTETDWEQNTRPFGIYGLPVISIPCGFTKDGMPIGIQLCAPRFAEAIVLALANAYQEQTDWHKRRAPLQPDTRVPELSGAASQQTGS